MSSEKTPCKKSALVSFFFFLGINYSMYAYRQYTDQRINNLAITQNSHKHKSKIIHVLTLRNIRTNDVHNKL